MSLANGSILHERYRIVAALGAGGMGAVYRAWDLHLDGPVAVKEAVPQPGLDTATLQQLRAQFKQEAVILSRLNHPHLVRVRDFFEEDGNAYLVMDLLQGESLADRIQRQGRLAEAEVQVWLAQLLEALDYCHRQGVLHRDIKPQNILIDQEERAVLVDFGLVKLWNPDDPQTRTVLRGMGTPEYAPPEQYGKQGQSTDPRSDLYSLGATFYHALTGQAPPTASDRMADPHLFRPVRAWNPGVSTALEAVILRALEPPREARFASAAQMLAALEGSAPREKTARLRKTALLPTPATAKLPRRPKRLLSGVVGAAVLLGFLFALFTNLKPKPPEPLPPQPTQTSAASATAPATVTSTPAATSTTEPAAGAQQVALRRTDGMPTVYVPAGEFQMGSEALNNEKPIHTVALAVFWIDQREVSNAQYQQCVMAGKCSPSIYANNATYNGATLPVVGVSWHDAAAYCAWAGARLPTEAEWEYAARGPESYIYPWGNDWRDDAANCWGHECADGYDYAAPAPVGNFPTGASWVGALDMAGNVLEWTADWYGLYPAERQENPTGPDSGAQRVLRGGSRESSSSGVRSAYRFILDPSSSSSTIGFRCAASVQSEE